LAIHEFRQVVAAQPGWVIKTKKGPKNPVVVWAVVNDDRGPCVVGLTVPEPGAGYALVPPSDTFDCYAFEPDD
jgi:hypothetical protein